MRVEAGAVVDEFAVPGLGLVVARYHRDGPGWAAAFTVVADAVADLALVHRLAAPSLAAARTAVGQAVEYLRGDPVDPR